MAEKPFKVQGVDRMSGGLPDADVRSKYGTFKDNLQSPIHRWFTYPAGYSYRLIEKKIADHSLGQGHRIGDPFVGAGTTCLTAKLSGISSVGTEAHPFVYDIARSKIEYEHDTDHLFDEAERIRWLAAEYYAAGNKPDGWPGLIYKCFTEDNLCRLGSLRLAVEGLENGYQPFFKTALTATLRDSASAGTGWPYIAPSKYAEKKTSKDAFVEFEKRCASMIKDIKLVMDSDRPDSDHQLFMGDARKFSDYSGKESLDMVITSPPYLNNYDYADRTRMETYFWGIYENWGEITKNVRDRLIIAATTQIRRGEMQDAARLKNVASVSPRAHQTLTKAIKQLSEERMNKSGKKSYDLMVAGYFEDMIKVIVEVFRSLRKGAQFILIVGDSAPYGVHIATEELIADMAIDAGFSGASIEMLRTRGDKWAGNSQRHKVPLKESIVTLVK